MGLYPTPVTVVGTVLENGRVNFLTIAHVGVTEHKRLLISVDKGHALSDAAIAKNGVVSVSLVNREMLEAVDYCGIAKGAKEDKSTVFAHRFDELEKAPIIEKAPLCMTCRIIKTVEVGSFHNYILQPVHTYVQEEYINEKGKIDYASMKPILFEFQNLNYLETGAIAGKCWNIGKNYKK